jgi:predicted TPR repeat methyltransferase
MPEQKSNFSPKAELLSMQQSLSVKTKGFGLRAMQRLFGLTQGWEGHRDIVKNNYDLGCSHLAKGNLRDAVLRLKMVTWLDPKHADGWYQLGCAYAAQRKVILSKVALKHSLELKPGNEAAIYMLAVAGDKIPPDQLPKRMPLSLTQQHFDRVAARFTYDQINIHQYQGHKLLVDAIRARLLPDHTNYDVLELGVGSGLCGPLIREVSSQLNGVDISGPMLAEAKKLQGVNGKPVYDVLSKREAYEFIREVQPESYDVVFAGDLFSYIGDVGNIFTHAARVLKPGGIFAFTADKTDDDGFKLDVKAGRFLFSKKYFETEAADNKLKVMTCEAVPLYPKYEGWLCVLTK